MTKGKDNTKVFLKNSIEKYLILFRFFDKKHIIFNPPRDRKSCKTEEWIVKFELLSDIKI